MKRKLLTFLLAIISAICLCVGLSACGLLNELSGNTTDTEQSSSDDNGTEQGSTDDDGTEQDSSGDNGTEQGSTNDDGTEQDSSGDNGSEQDTTGDDGTEQDTTGDDGSESGSTDDDDSEQDTTGDDGSESGSTDDDDSEQGSTDDDDSEQDTTGDDGSESGSTDDDDSEQDTTGDDGSEQDTTGDDDSEQGSTEDDDSEQDTTGGETAAGLTARAGNSTYGYSQLASETNGTDMQSLYYQMYTACESFISDESDVTLSNGYYTISEIFYGDSLTTAKAISVWEVFYLENPMYYWLLNSCVYSAGASKIYLCIDGTYASYSVRQVYDAEISEMITEASALVAQKSTELEKAMAVHDYIIEKINYAYQSDGTTPETAIWAHNITGVSSKGAGVCEAYSKTYLALCLINGLDCIIVTGNSLQSGEDHAWNIVKIDGAWYGVDCTWDDTGDDDNLSYVYFGMNADTIDSTRVTGSAVYGVNYLYALPEITTRGIQLVTLFRGTTELGTYANVDAAFDAMTDSTADYTIELYFYSSTGVKVETSPATTIYIYSEYTPAVNSITINGIYTDLGGGYFYASYLNTDGTLTLKCDLQISNIIFTADGLDLGEYTLTTGGTYCRLCGSIYDNKTTDAVSIKSATTSSTDIYAALNVSYYYGSASISGTAVIGTYYGSGSLVVYGTVTVDKYVSANETNYYNIYLQGGADLTVNNLVYDSGSAKIIYILIQFDSIDEYPALYMGSVEAQTYLYVSGYVSSSVAATPSKMDCAIATLGSADDFDNIKIIFDGEDKTLVFSVNSDNEIVFSLTTNSR